MKHNRKLRKIMLRITNVGLVVSVVVAGLTAFLPNIASVLLFIAPLLTAATIALAQFLFIGMDTTIINNESIAEHRKDCAEIVYDKKNDIAYVTGKLAEITGFDIASSTLAGVEYHELITEMIASPSDVTPDTYMAARPECWIKVDFFENDEFEFTTITDASEFVACKNIIKSLKYYDADTGLLCRDAFISKVRTSAGAKAGTVGLVTLIISGVDKLTSFKGTLAADAVIKRAAGSIKRYENPHNIFAGRTATNEFCVLITDTYDDGCRKYADKIYKEINDSLRDAEGSEYLRIYCGYAFFSDDSDAASMMSSADYAAYEAKSSSADAPVEFDRDKYVMKAFDFRKTQVFNRIINDNTVSYSFQPVVNAHTGVIFGYEALMRPPEIDGIKLTPPEVVEIAAHQGMSSSVEYLTLSNTVAFLSENIDFFGDKKLFVNTIPNCFITDEKYNSIFEGRENVYGNLIIEVTEGVQITEKSIELMRERYCSKGALIAMDDYGTGYANESTLISIKPDFIKIDRSLIEGIASDVRKQHLVSNMINFAQSHGIKTLGEGVETKEELEVLITFGIDLIQGYYTSRPNSVLAEKIPERIKDEILDINLKNVGYEHRIYKLDNSEPVDISELAAEGYSDIHIASENANLVGNSSRTVNMRIKCGDSYTGTINVRNVNIFGVDTPVLTIGSNSDVTLNIEGKNSFSYEGIRVPETSRFTLTGSGDLNIEMNRSEGIILGGTSKQTFGTLVLNMQGNLHISSQSREIIAVGGGIAGKNSEISLLSGSFSAELKGHSIAGIGSYSGDPKITLKNCGINITASGQRIVGVGSGNGRIDMKCTNVIAAADCSGDRCCAFGTLDNGSGSMTFDGGKYELTIHSKNSVGIGAVGGNTDVLINSGVYNIFCEGNNAVGIGDSIGSGSVTLKDGIFKMHLAASEQLPLGSAEKAAVISGGNIVSDSNVDIKAVSPAGAALTEVRTSCSGEFCHKIHHEGSEYTYLAEAVKGENVISIYLPVGYSLDN